jgi:tmRNA-binding protein
LKTYYKRKCERHDQLNEQLATANDMLKDLFAEDKRKNAKLLAKNQEIQQLKEPIEKQLCDLVQQLKDYTIESGNVLGYDERTPIEFVNIFLNKTK